MSYNLVEKKLKANGVVILDGGNGGELESSGAKMDKDLWAGKCAIDDPDKMLQVHEKYINAGADIITSNTYAITPISMKEYGYDQFTKAWNEESVKLALKAANHSKREIAVAGSVSTSGSWDKLSEEDIKPGFNEHLKILKEAGVDLIILEAMASKMIRSTPASFKIFKCSLKPGLISSSDSLSQLPEVETDPATAISLLEWLAAFKANFTLSSFQAFVN